jgi:hypothetical protein
LWVPLVKGCRCIGEPVKRGRRCFGHFGKATTVDPANFRFVGEQETTIRTWRRPARKRGYRKLQLNLPKTRLFGNSPSAGLTQVNRSAFPRTKSEKKWPT